MQHTHVYHSVWQNQHHQEGHAHIYYDCMGTSHLHPTGTLEHLRPHRSEFNPLSPTTFPKQFHDLLWDLIGIWREGITGCIGWCLLPLHSSDPCSCCLLCSTDWFVKDMTWWIQKEVLWIFIYVTVNDPDQNNISQWFSSHTFSLPLAFKALRYHKWAQLVDNTKLDYKFKHIYAFQTLPLLCRRVPTMCPGATHLSCQVMLENHQKVADKAQTYVYNVVIYCSHIVAKTQESLCSLHYYTPDKEDVPPNRIYDITAQVMWDPL